MTTEQRLTAAEARIDALEAILMGLVSSGNTTNADLAKARGIAGNTDYNKAVVVIERVYQLDM